MGYTVHVLPGAKGLKLRVKKYFHFLSNFQILETLLCKHVKLQGSSFERFYSKKEKLEGVRNVLVIANMGESLFIKI